MINVVIIEFLGEATHIFTNVLFKATHILFHTKSTQLCRMLGDYCSVINLESVSIAAS